MRCVGLARLSLSRVADMTARQKVFAAFQEWYDALPRPRTTDAAPAKGSIAIALVLLERLKTHFDLNFESHLAPGRAQIQGASGSSVRAILAEFGETRSFVGEGGRTNRGTPAIGRSLLDALAAAGLDGLPEVHRVEILKGLQEILVGKVREFHNRERLRPIYDPAESTRQFVVHLLALAEETGKRGPVAQYLVGAKLELRFPEFEVRNESYAAADEPSGRAGDFEVADAVFHVTVAPTTGHFDKCTRNLQDGRRVFLLVPDAVLAGARQNADMAAPRRIAVEAIESFVGQNIEELSNFGNNRVGDGLLRLLETYNRRVDAVEIDKAMMVEIPKNLGRRGSRA